MLKNEQNIRLIVKNIINSEISLPGIVNNSAKFNKFNPYFSNIFLIKVLII